MPRTNTPYLRLVKSLSDFNVSRFDRPEYLVNGIICALVETLNDDDYDRLVSLITKPKEVVNA